MTTLKLSDEKAKSLYKTAAPEFKTLLEENFTKEFFSEKITDRIKSFTDVVKVLRLDSDDFDENYNSDLTADELAYKKLKAVVKALNEGWEPNWKNQNEYKWIPYFDMSNGFVLRNVSDWYQRSNVGSRLCFKSRELAEYAAKQFSDIYKTYMVIP